MITPEAAWDLLLPWLAPLPVARRRRDEAGGRILAEPLAATVDVPFADVSAMDGFALAGEVSAGAELPIVGTVAAGTVPAARLAAGAAMRIMTGAVVPDGADRVVPVEQTSASAAMVSIVEPPAAGAHIRRRGEVVRSGDRLLAAGELLTPGALALLATHGIDEVPVHAAPRVALLVTGDEVVAAHAAPGPGQLRDSHSSFLAAAVAARGGAFRHLGIAADDAAALRAGLEAGLDGDLLLVTGGVSKGTYDLVEPALADLGFTPLFDGVTIQPGGPLVAAVRPGERRPLLAFGLPGNPASVMVGFWLLVAPALQRLQGVADAFWEGALEATLLDDAPGAGARDRFLPVRISLVGERLHATPLLPRGSHDLAAYARGTGLLRLRAGAPPAAAGEACSVLPILARWG